SEKTAKLPEEQRQMVNAVMQLSESNPARATLIAGLSEAGKAEVERRTKAKAEKAERRKAAKPEAETTPEAEPEAKAKAEKKPAAKPAKKYPPPAAPPSGGAAPHHITTGVTSMNPITRDAAHAAIQATRDARQALDAHSPKCQRCMWHKPCDPRATLQREVYMASQTSRTALLAYAPQGSTVEYHGPAVHLHGVWRVSDTCRGSLHTTYLLYAARSGAIIDDVSIDDIRQPIEPEPSGMLAAVRRAVAEITRLLATCGYLLHV